MKWASILAIAALAALVVALIIGGIGSTVAAVAVVLLAAAGIVALLRDWRTGPEPAPAPLAAPERSAGELTPDISTDPDGPSSDARADQL